MSDKKTLFTITELYDRIGENENCQEWDAATGRILLNSIQELHTLIEAVQMALGTKETGYDLVVVARQAHQAEQEWAKFNARLERGELQSDAPQPEGLKARWRK